jgi:hypothetical protein
MSRGKHTEAEMIGALKQLEVGRTAADVARTRSTLFSRTLAWERTVWKSRWL